MGSISLLNSKETAKYMGQVQRKAKEDLLSGGISLSKSRRAKTKPVTIASKNKIN
jgi:hypothetical protein